MNQSVKQFIDTVIGEVKYKKAHPYLLHELQDHIECIKEDYISEGSGEDEAYTRAIKQMGDPHTIGTQLHKTHRPKMDWCISLLFGIIIVIGLFALRSHSVLSPNTNQFQRHLSFIIIGIILLLIIRLIDYRYFKKWAIPLYALGIGILLYAYIYGSTMNGKVLLRVGPIVVLANYLTLPLFIVSYVGIAEKWKRGLLQGLFLCFLALIPVFLILKLPSLSSAIILAVVCFLILTLHICSHNFQGNKKRTLAALYSSAIVFLSLAAFKLLHNAPYMLARLNFFFETGDANSYIRRNINAVTQGASLIGKGNLSDVGNWYLSNEQSSAETIFTFIIGRFGWLTAGILLLAICLVLLMMFKKSYNLKDTYGKIVALSITATYTLQFGLNIMMNLGYMPIISCPLPFVSYGGIDMITNLALLGIYLSIYRRKDINYEVSSTIAS